ncbi:MAG: hypothetical protein J7L21_02825 [Sulfurimonas sp.]|nr:hypothetical protein [Sulfurimonas sp.]
MTEVNKGELAKHIGKSAAIVSRLINNGIMNDCFTPSGKKIYLEKALKAITLAKGNDYLGLEIITNDKIKNNSSVYNAESITELEDLLRLEKSPSRKIEMMDKFWAYKIKKQKFKQEEGELITVDDAKATIEVLFSPLDRKLNDLHIDLKSRFAEIPIDAIEWLSDYINDMKKSISEYEWES